jgi:hypothetical protein
MVIGCESFWSEVMTGQVQQFASDLKSGEVEVVSDGFDLDVCQSAMEPHHGVLKDIIGLFPSTKDRVASQHLSGKSEQAFAGMVEQRIVCGWVPLEIQIDQSLEFGVGIGCHGRFPRRMRPLFYDKTNEKPSYLLCEIGSRKGTEKSFLFLMSLLSGGGTQG